jgi:hypothetical protein
MIGDEERAVEELADLLRSGRRINGKECIEGFDSRHVVRLGTNTANTVRYDGHVLCPAPDAELLEAAEFGYLEICPCNIPFGCEEDLDFAMTFKPCNRID